MAVILNCSVEPTGLPIAYDLLAALTSSAVPLANGNVPVLLFQTYVKVTELTLYPSSAAKATEPAPFALR